jgi:uncharacterized protein YegJ (DUF2314 family)
MPRHSILRQLPLVAAMLLLLITTDTGCKRSSGAQTKAEPEAEVALPKDPVVFEMALYLLAPPRADLDAQVRAARSSAFKEFADIDPKQKPTGPALRARVAPLEEYAPPTQETLRYAGRGITPELATRLQRTQAAWVIDFACPPTDAAATVRRASDMMFQLAKKNDAVIWDELTREVFSTDAWKERRIDGWDEAATAAAGSAGATTRPAAIPNVARHITIHYYTATEGRPPRAITLGMAKFGCPDVVMQEVPRVDSDSASALINLVCQVMVERGAPAENDKPRSFTVDLNAVRHRKVKDEMIASLKGGAKRSGTLTIRPAARDEGDPSNRLIELTFDHHPGKTPIERQSAFLAGLFGVDDRISNARHDDAELNAARDAARRVLLAEKKPAFRKGLPVGDLLLVKAPFKTRDGGQEWMWVEVMRWDASGAIRGILQNQPAYVPTLKAGAEVTVSEKDLFDYIHRHADGTTEGNETGKILERQGG